MLLRIRLPIRQAQLRRATDNYSSAHQTFSPLRVSARSVFHVSIVRNFWGSLRQTKSSPKKTFQLSPTFYPRGKYSREKRQQKPLKIALFVQRNIVQSFGKRLCESSQVDIRIVVAYLLFIHFIYLYCRGIKIRHLRERNTCNFVY